MTKLVSEGLIVRCRSDHGNVAVENAIKGGESSIDVVGIKLSRRKKCTGCEGIEPSGGAHIVRICPNKIDRVWVASNVWEVRDEADPTVGRVI